MLSDNEKLKKVKARPRRSTKLNTTIRGGKWWSDSQKIETVQLYLMLGNIAEVGRRLSIPYITIRTWKTSEWWKEITEALKSQENILFGNRLRTVIDDSIGVVHERLLHGDYIYDQKSGELRRKPVLMKDALKVTTELIDKRQKIEKPEYDQVAQEGVMERLEKLAKSFEQFAVKKIDNEAPIIEVTDVIFGKEESRDAIQSKESSMQELPSK